jgi:hypothetical protein
MAEREFRVYISSTIDDLTEERTSARLMISKYGVVSDSYRASEDGTVDNCVRDVQGADLYVAILGHRYGWLPDDKVNPEGKSITELEYEACRTPGKPKIPRLIFIRTNSDDKFRDSENRPVTAERIARFRKRAGQDQQALQFSDIGELKLQISEAVRTKREEFQRRELSRAPTFDPVNTMADEPSTRRRVPLGWHGRRHHQTDH